MTGFEWVYAALKAVPGLSRGIAWLARTLQTAPPRSVGPEDMLTVLRAGPKEHHHSILSSYADQWFHVSGQLIDVIELPKALFIKLKHGGPPIIVNATVPEKFDDKFRPIAADGWWTVSIEGQLDPQYFALITPAELYLHN